LEDLDAEVEINSAWDMVREDIKFSAKESNWGSVRHGMTKDDQNYEIKENRLNCSGYGIQVK
jgi:hypothetical protein